MLIDLWDGPGWAIGVDLVRACWAPFQGCRCGESIASPTRVSARQSDLPRGRWAG